MEFIGVGAMHTGESAAKAAAYVRVSTDEQAEKGTSLDSQAERIREYCAQHGIPVVDTYTDDGYSGATMDRPELQRLLHDAREGRFNLVLVYKLDRLSRNLKDAINLVLGELESYGVRFQSITEPFHTLEAAGKMMFANLASFADYEREQIRERCNRGRMTCNREGRFTGGHLPYGIGWDKAKEAFFVVEKEAKIYRKIFGLCVHDGLSPGEIGRYLNKEGHTTRRGHYFSPTHVRHLLLSPAACGDWNRHRLMVKVATDPLRQRNLAKPTYNLRLSRPKEEWIRVPLPPIVARDLWERAQSMIAVHRKPEPIQTTALCIGLLFCGECGSRVGIRQDKKRGRRPRYACFARMLRRDSRYPRYRAISCDLPTFDQKHVDEMVWRQIEELISDPGRLWELVYGGEATDERESLQQRVKELRRKVHQAQAQEERAARLYALGASAKTAEKQLKEAASRRRALETDLAQAEQTATNIPKRQADKERVFDTLQKLRGQIHNLTLDRRREILRFLVPGGMTDRIELHADGSVHLRGILTFGHTTPGMRVPYSDKCYFK